MSAIKSGARQTITVVKDMFIVNNKTSANVSNKRNVTRKSGDFLVASHEILFFDIILANPFSFDIEVDSIEIMLSSYIIIYLFFR